MCLGPPLALLWMPGLQRHLGAWCLHMLHPAFRQKAHTLVPFSGYLLIAAYWSVRLWQEILLWWNSAAAGWMCLIKVKDAVDCVTVHIVTNRAAFIELIFSWSNLITSSYRTVLLESCKRFKGLKRDNWTRGVKLNKLHRRMAQHRRDASTGQDSVVHLHLKEKGQSFEDNNVHRVERWSQNKKNEKEETSQFPFFDFKKNQYILILFLNCFLLYS